MDGPFDFYFPPNGVITKVKRMRNHPVRPLSYLRCTRDEGVHRCLVYWKGVGHPPPPLDSADYHPMILLHFFVTNIAAAVMQRHNC